MNAGIWHVKIVNVCFLFLRCVDMVKSSQYVELANDLEINKAITYLRQKDFNQVRVSAALRVLPSFLVCVFYNHTFHS